MWFVFLGAWAVCAAFGHWFKCPGSASAHSLSSRASEHGVHGLSAGRGSAAGKRGLRWRSWRDPVGLLPGAGDRLELPLPPVLRRETPAGRHRPRILLFPPFLTLLVGVSAGSLAAWPAPLANVYERVGATLTPLALFSVRTAVHAASQPARSRSGRFCPGLETGGCAATRVPGRSCPRYPPGPSRGTVLQSAWRDDFRCHPADQHGLDPRSRTPRSGSGFLLSLATVPLLNRLV